jgi:hypothetical protein
LLDFEARILAARFNRWVQGGEEMIAEGEGGLIIVVTTHNSLGHQRRGGAELQKQQAEKKLRKNKNKIKSKNRRGGPGLWGVCANHLETISTPVGGGICYGDPSLATGRKKFVEHGMAADSVMRRERCMALRYHIPYTIQVSN